MNRRQFLKTSGAVGLGALLFRAPLALGETADARPQVAKRKFGRTGVEVSHLGLGCMFDIINNQVILKTALDHGVMYWDTAAAYERTGSETGIGMFFVKNPGARKDVFLVSKGRGNLMQALDGSLGRLKTDHIDLYFVHGIKSIAEVDRPEVKAFAEEAKRSGKIKFFGFSTHENMAQCLSDAAKLGWIDGIMLTFNYREMHKPEMKAALTACEQAGIGLTAMKTQAGRAGHDTPEQAALLDPITAQGFTPGQAKLKAVMEHPQIACACIQMPNMKLCRENIAAALDQRALPAAAKVALNAHAEATCNRYCGGCSHLCGATVANAVSIRDVMRHLMYYHNYAELDARAMWAELPIAERARLTEIDYTAAEQVCPHRLPIADLMREASELLT